MPGPSIVHVGPVDVNIFDTLFLVSFVLFFASVTLNRKIYYRLNGITCIGLSYPVLVVFLSTLGIIVFGYPSDYAVGDMRWIQAIFLATIIYHAYRNSYIVIGDLKYVFYWGIIINITFVVFQVIAATGGEPPSLLEWWYMDVPETSSRPLGFHINRFGGATGQPSTLGVLGGISIAYSLIAMNRKIGQLFILTGGTFLLVSSGSRTALISTLVVVGAYLISTTGPKRIRIVLYSCMSILILTPVVVNLNLGRMGTGRYQEILELAAGDKDYQEVSNRTETWRRAVNIRTNKYTVLGTLSNPSNVHSKFVVDSAYIHVFLRLGIVGLFSLLAMPLVPIFSLYKHGISKNVALPLAIFLFFAIVGVNSNTVTSLSYRCMSTLSVFMAYSK